MSSCLFECLKEAGLEEYYSSLQLRGFDTAFSLLYVRPAELQDVGITTDTDRQRFLQLVQIIASFHQGGELSPRRAVSPSRHLIADDREISPSGRGRRRRLKSDLSVREIESSLSATDSESSVEYIDSYRHKGRSKSAPKRSRAARNMALDSARYPSPSAGLCLGVDRFKVPPVTVTDSRNFPLERAIIVRRTPGNNRDRNNNNLSQNQRHSHPRSDASEHALATPAVRKPPAQEPNLMKVQRVVHSASYDYGLPKENKPKHTPGTGSKSEFTVPQSERQTNCTPAPRSRVYETSHIGASAVHHARAVNSSPKTHQRITVCVRKRPLIGPECEAGEFDVVTCNREDGGKEGGLVVHELKRTVDMSEFVQQNIFQFDKVFSEITVNKDIYDGAIKPLVDWIMTKNNRATCFGYGQTGAGKTHTLLGSQREPGVFLHAAKDVLSRLSGPHANARAGKRGFTLLISLYEIYCSRIFDLLNNHKRLQALEDSSKQVRIHGLKMVPVEDLQSLVQVLNEGLSERSVGVTGANRDSSRSHAIVQLTVQDANGSEFSRLSFIDLAGSERACDALRDSDKQNRLEGAEINQSLLALKECIRSLDLELAHTPFRQSKLTQVLRDSFIGSSKTCMIANISPSHSSLEHTMNTLRYASRVKELRRKSTVSPSPRHKRRPFVGKCANAKRPFTAGVTPSKARSPGLAKPPSDISRSVSIESSMKVMDYSAYTGNGRELSRTPPPTSKKFVFGHEHSSVAASVFIRKAVGLSSTPKEKDDRGDTGINFVASDNASTTLASPNDDPRHNRKKAGGTSSPAASFDESGENELPGHSTVVDSGSIPYSTGPQDTVSSPAVLSTVNKRCVSESVCHNKENGDAPFVSEGTSSAVGSSATDADSTSATPSSANDGTLIKDVTPETNALPRSKSGTGLPSPQKFLTYLKDKHGLKTKKLRLKGAKHLRSGVLSDTNAGDEETSDHSTASSARSASNPSSTQSAPNSISLGTQVSKAGTNVRGPMKVADGPTPPRLPSPKLDRSLPRRSSRTLHGASPRSLSPSTGAHTTPDGDSVSSSPSTTTGVTSVSELHARLEAAARNLAGGHGHTEDTVTMSDKDVSNSRRSSQQEDMRRAQSEVVIAHQEHISEILRISIEEERLYHELREKWENGTSFETYTRSLEKLLMRKTRSIEALKVQLALYQRVCGTPG